ncbi:FtsX-like permease family protein [Streptomyces sp. Je 1-4]|uniref:ABC transporter permease n=1 Tax=Streptomyces TaxID=1883 RepID=UPI0021DB7327|nr:MULTISPECIES: FtsX-like permease family protein [unclassified Streptomyces]UYB38193.1 FtsX-like permease family protein [Streptomyces sp. Je 1-4]UZQ34134.1 FtsX-like permease family protein [Streptomyces sp. Je 1-4] [Streptomyces sp. Je 1-4 4N24]UZQ41552.1 FtsX-like permease family protein [Streptomyces sp. Je 1-4] [Streptomyces sp. Je 1-4 4N24_ara]
MLRTALRNVLAHKARLIMTALAVLLGVAFVSGTLVFADTTANAFRSASARSLEGVAVSVRAGAATATDPAASDMAGGEDGKPATALDSALVRKIGQLPGVASVRPTVHGEVTLAGKDGRPVNADTNGLNLATNYHPGKDGKDSRFPLTEGRGPATEGELALDATTAEKAGYRTGDTVRFATDGPALTRKLVGIVTTNGPQATAGGSLTLFDTRTAQKLFHHPGRFDEIAVSAGPGADEDALTERVQALLPKDGVSATSGAELAAEQSTQIARSTGYLTKTLLVFAGVALFVGVFLIANTFTMLIAQRSREIALLRAVGASRRQVVRSVLIEAALLGLVASAGGFSLGLGIAAALRPLLNTTGAALPDGPLVITPAAPLASLAVGVLVTVLAAWLPSRRAAKIAPVAALSSVDQAPPARALMLRNVFGTLLTAAGVGVMLYVATLKTSSESHLMTAMLGATLTLGGVIALAPLLSRPLITLAGNVTTRFFGVGGKLAEQNALRNPRRTAATASALMIGLALITGLTVGAHSAQYAMAKEATQGLTADYKVNYNTARGLDPAEATKIARIPGVAAAAPVATAQFSTHGEYAVITGTDPKAFGKAAQLDFRSGSLDAVGPGKIAVSDEFAGRAGLRVGATLDAETVGGTDSGKAHKKKLTVVGIYAKTRTTDEALGTLTDVLPYSVTKELDKVLVKAEPGKAAGLDRTIRAALGDSPLLKVRSQEQLVKENNASVTTVLSMMYGLLGMAVVIAILGVVNTLAMSVFERTREIGMLRAIGLDRAGIRQMVRLESVVISLFGAVLGIGTGIFLAWAGGGLTTSSMPEYETVLPWGRLGTFLVLALMTGVLAAIWPARRAARLNMLQSLQPS